MVYGAEVLVVAAVAAVLAAARVASPSAAERPSGPTGLMMPLDKAHLISGDTSESSGHRNSAAVQAKTTQCQIDGGYCFKNNKKEKKKCAKLNGKIEKNMCTGRDNCCIIATTPTEAPHTAAPTTKPPTTTDAIENMLKEIMMLINNQEIEFKSLKDNQDIILSTLISLVNDVMMKLSKFEDKVDDILEHLVVCDPQCLNGNCTAPNTCTCDPGWEGQQCQNGLLEKVNIAKSGGIAKASSSHVSGKYQPNLAFGDSGSWHSEGPYTVPQTLWVEFNNPLRIVRYSFTSWANNGIYVVHDGPSKYIFWASNHDDCTDESQWVILHVDDSGTPFTSDNAPKEVTVENRDSFRCYGFKVNDVPGRDGIKPVVMGNVNLYSYKAM